MVDDAVKIGIEFIPLLDGFGKFLRNLLYARLDAFTPDALNITEELYTKYKSCAQSLTNGDILRISKMLIDLQGTLRYSTNPRLLVETTFARMAWLDRLVDLRKALAAINDPKSAENDAVKKKVTEVSAMIDAQEEVQASYDDPFAGYDQGGVQAFSRYEIAAAWPSILSNIANDGDYVFSAAIAGTTLETGDPEQNPFPIALTYAGTTENAENWGYRQMTEHPEYVERVTRILEDRLQTKIALSIRTRAFTESELAEQRAAKMSPYELDLEKEPGLSKLQQMFATELVFTKKLKKAAIVSQCDDEDCDA
jgi:DNA polymerase-3 subunit gamma/tau